MIDESAYPKFVLTALKKVAKTPEELLELLYRWDERCGIRHFEGGQFMDEAEAEALKEILAGVAGGNLSKAEHTSTLKQNSSLL